MADGGGRVDTLSRIDVWTDIPPGPEGARMLQRLAGFMCDALHASTRPGKPPTAKWRQADADRLRFHTKHFAPPPGASGYDFTGKMGTGHVEEGVTGMPSASKLAKATYDPAWPENRDLLARAGRVLRASLSGQWRPVPTSTTTHVIDTLDTLAEVLDRARQEGIVCIDFETKPKEPGLKKEEAKAAQLDFNRSLPTCMTINFQEGEGWLLPLYHYHSPFDTGCGDAGDYTPLRYDGDPAGPDALGDSLLPLREENRIRCVADGTVDMVREKVMPLVAGMFDTKGLIITGHNVKFDLSILSLYGVRAWECAALIDDTLAMRQLIDETVPNGLKPVADSLWPEYHGYGKGVDYANDPLSSLGAYCVADGDLSLRLHSLLTAELLKDAALYRAYRNLERPKIKLLAGMEAVGMPVSSEALAEGLSMAADIIASTSSDVEADPSVKAFTDAERTMALSAKRDALLAELHAADLDAEERVLKRLEGAKEGSKPHADLLAALKAVKAGDHYAGAYPYQRGREKRRKLDMLEADAKVYAGFDPLNPNDLRRFIYGDHGLAYPMPVTARKLKNKETGLTEIVVEEFGSTDKDDIAMLPSKPPILDQVLDLRTAERMRGTYFEGVGKRVDGAWRIHSSFSTIRSARLSSSNPNLQNLPSRTKSAKVKPLVSQVKRMFHPPAGYEFFECDLSQAELRWAAELWGLRSFKLAYQQGKDMHVLSACGAQGVTLERYAEMKRDNPDKADYLRYTGKALNFGFLYGAGAETFQEYARVNYGLEFTIEEATRFRDGYMATHPDIAKGHALYLAKARRWGWVRTRFGTRRRLDYINSNNPKKRSEDERKAVNSPVQGSSAQGLLFALCVFRHRAAVRGLDGWIANTVHDSALGWVRPEHKEEFLKLLCETMANPPTLPYFGFDFAAVGMKVDAKAGTNWKDLADVKL
jgi:DNA polymerase I-like protein with 3'-5' exonuclease and polymerase domains